MCIIGLDLSTRAMGFSILSKSKKVKIITCDFLDFGDSKVCIEDKFSMFCDMAGKMVDDRADVFIEEYIKRFTPGRSNADTITILAHFSGMVRGYFLQRGIKPVFISPGDARESAGMSRKKPKDCDDIKVYCRDILVERFGDLIPIWYTRQNNVRKQTFDASDSLVVALAGHNAIYKQAKAK